MKTGIRMRSPWPIAFSVLLHVSALMLLLSFTSVFVPEKEPITVDLTWIGSPARNSGSPTVKPPHRQMHQPRAASPAKVSEVPYDAPVPRPESPVQPSIAARDSMPLPSVSEAVQHKEPSGGFSGGISDAGSGTSKGLSTPTVASGISGGAGDFGNAADGRDRLRQRYMAEHFAYIKDIVTKNIVYPRRAMRRGWAGTVMVSLTVLETGRAENIRVLKSSGYDILDNNAVDTIKAIGSFPKPPVKAELHMPIRYQVE